MAYRVVFRYHRPNTSVEWYNNLNIDEDLTARMLEMMFGEFHGRKVRIVSEPNNLTLEIEFIWQDKSVYDDYASRSITIERAAAIKTYNDSVGITADPVEEEELWLLYEAV